MKIAKIFLGSVVVVVLLLLIIGVVVVALNLNTLIKKSVETYGPQITKVSIKLDTVNMDLLTGSAKISGLLVGNPQGYTAPQSISVNEASIGLNPFSVLSKKIIVRSIHIKSPDVTFEGGLNGNNLSKILDNVNDSAKTGGPVVTNSTGKPTPGKKFEVDEFLITGAKVHVILKDVGSKELTIPLPDIRLTDLGKNADGITAADLTRRIMQALVTATVKAVSNSASDLGKDAAGIGTDKIKKLLGK
jgi:uncharacterized protein involved in outer membrane biogenesis